MNLVSAHVNQILRKIHIITMKMCVQINKYKKNRDLMCEGMKFYHMTHSIKRIEILLSYNRDKNKFENRDFYFYLVQHFKTIFCYIFYLMF